MIASVETTIIMQDKSFSGWGPDESVEWRRSHPFPFPQAPRDGSVTKTERRKVFGVTKNMTQASSAVCDIYNTTTVGCWT